MISSLSVPMSGRRIGIPTTSVVRAMFSSVCDATWPRLSPVTRARAPVFRAIASVIRAMKRR